MVQNDILTTLFNTANTPFRAVGFTPVSSLLALITLNWITMNQDQDKIGIITENQTTFDFIVVGAGSSGAVIASRLSENGKYNVLLLEAGGSPPPITSYPLLAPFNVHLDTDWQYETVPQKNSCLGIKNRRMKWPRGKLLGGTSNLNWMLYVRGHPMDFNQWAMLSQDGQWAYENLLPYFKKLENYNGNFQKDARFHGKTGPLCVSKHHHAPLVETWVQAGKELGYYSGTDYNAYQDPAQIEIDEATKKATGVTYTRHGILKQAFATKEIIISAGAIGTPQLLLLSGIGPAKHLNSVGIQQKVNLPGVGQNLQDHVMLFFGPFVLNDTVSVMCKRNITLAAAAEYRLNKTGLLAYNFISGSAFINTSQAVPLSDGSYWSDAVLMFSPASMEDDDDGNTFAEFLGVDKKLFRDYVLPFIGKDAAWVLMTVGLPKSRGTIELASKDPFTHPNIDPNYFDRPEDLKVFVEAMQFVVNVFENTNAWQKYGARFAPGHKLANCQQYPEKSDKYFECFARTLTMTQWHPCCTAKFGKPKDPLAVLDSNLNVIGVQGLRVADASVMPVIPNANINVPCMMIGEKASDFILEDWENTNGSHVRKKDKVEPPNLLFPFDGIIPIASTLSKIRPLEALEALAMQMFR
ncbi:unnamed protein product [Orchesella dallaii]|uniref:Glucose-methanol-choline oxidoreductase N-terminal domain-containing protein n=1 Tax=Orchesella dallaii TaxID=48710 RepID=A0ABP1RMM1_9HEXA